MARPPSRADQDFSRRLRAWAIDLSPAGVQTCKEIGLLDAPERTFPGGGGSTSRYPTSVIERAREAKELLDKHPRGHYLAVLEMYTRGHHRVEETKLKRALHRYCERHDRMALDAAGAHHEDATKLDLGAAGEVMAERFRRDSTTREMRGRLPRDLDETRQDKLARVFAATAAMRLQGEPMPEQALTDLLKMGNLGAIDPTTGMHPIVAELSQSDLTEVAALGQTDVVRGAIERATLDDLELARDTWKTMVQFTSLAAKVEPRVGGDDWQPAYGLADLDADAEPAFTLGGALSALVLRGQDGGEFDAVAAGLRAQTRQWHALNDLLDALPTKFHGLYGPDGSKLWKSFGPRERQQHNQLRADFEARHLLAAPLLTRYTFTDK